VAFTLVVVAAGLAGCSGGTRSPLYTDRETPLPPGQGMLGDALTYDSSKRVASPAPSGAPATAAEQEEFRKWRESAGSPERREFEEWRAWQEWKRNNPK